MKTTYPYSTFLVCPNQVPVLLLVAPRTSLFSTLNCTQIVLAAASVMASPTAPPRVSPNYQKLFLLDQRIVLQLHSNKVSSWSLRSKHRLTSKGSEFLGKVPAVQMSFMYNI